MKYLTLNNNLTIPQLGFGTADIGSDRKTSDVIKTALEAGFRRFDTASMYGNEAPIGRAIREGNISRDEIIVATKLWSGGNYSYKNTLNEINKSQSRLGLDYIDIYLQHWPVSKQRLEAWTAMQEKYETGEIKSIGVSNYTISHLEELIHQREVVPVINQVEFNPFLFQNDLLRYCNENNIVLEAYSPFSKAKKLDHPVIAKIASNYEKSPAQILLRWGIQLGISIIPKSSTPKHIQQNFDIFDFELKLDAMREINNLNENFRIEWDPSNVD